MAASSSRPRLQARAITELGPLVDRDQYTGTHASIGGPRIAGGSHLPGGAFAPVSPFLPLPPAPTAEELRQQEASRTPRISPLTQRPILASGRSARSTSSTFNNNMQRARVHQTPPATSMIRSYSVPVSTQKEYEQQCRAFKQQDKAAEPAAHSPWSAGWPGTPTSFTANREQRQQFAEALSFMRSDGNATRKPMSPLSINKHLVCASAGASPKNSGFPAAVLSTYPEVVAQQAGSSGLGELEDDIEMINDDDPASESMYGAEEPSLQDSSDSYFAPRTLSLEHSDSPSDVNSDGPDTPRASTPSEAATSMRSSLSKQQWGAHARQNTVDDEVNGGFIHPAHLEPPATSTTSTI